MVDDSIFQASSLIKSSKTVAIVLPEVVDLDCLMSAVALQSLCKNYEVAASIFSTSATIPVPMFMSQQVEIRPGFSKSDQFAVKISNKHAKPSELRYELADDGIVVYLTSTEGEFLTEDVSVLLPRKKFDAIILVGVQNLDQLGVLYKENPAIFFETPHIVIDNNPANEYFGTVNVVKVIAASISEVVMDIVESFDNAIQNDAISTSLLAGIISKTESFRSTRTTPETLAKSARLISAGARQQDIIQYLFKTKPLPILQLWGRALARIVTVPDSGLLYTSIIQSDFEKTQATAEDLPEVLRDMVEMVTGFSVAAIFAETARGVEVLVAGLPHVPIVDLAAQLGATVAPFALTGKFNYVTIISDKKSSDLQEIVISFAKSLPQ